MQLGTLMAQFEDEQQAGTALEALDDLVLFARIDAAGAEHDETPGEYVANAARRFTALASDEDWLAIMNAIERSDDPGRAVLRRMLVWALDADSKVAKNGSGCGGGVCTCGGTGQHEQGHP
jgi:hypothetical protein